MDRFVDSHFEDKRVIYIAGDADPKGEELKQELLRRLGRERCRVVSYGEGCKDANELFGKGRSGSIVAGACRRPGDAVGRRIYSGRCGRRDAQTF